MNVTSIIENTSEKALPVEHGLSLYIEKDDGQKILFDMGQSALFAHNAEILGLSIAGIDVAVISHGHYDHGGGLATFIQMNATAKVFIQRDAFLPYFSLHGTNLHYIGLDRNLATNQRLVFCDKTVVIDDGMTLFADVQGDCCFPTGNRFLYGPTETEHDLFRHEQNLLIQEGRNLVLFAGCAHRGIVNILRKAEKIAGKSPTHVFAGLHLAKNGLKEANENTLISMLAAELKKYDQTMFYTMHCTGTEQFSKLKSLMGSQIEYLACGDKITI